MLNEIKLVSVELLEGSWINAKQVKANLFTLTDKPSILQLSSTCAVKDSEVLCHCSVDSNPKAAVTWSVNGTVPPHDYNVSVTSDTDTLTASLRGHMDEPLRVTCFAFNFLGNDSLVLLQGEEGEFKVLSLLSIVRKAAALPLVCSLWCWTVCTSCSLLRY